MIALPEQSYAGLLATPLFSGVSVEECRQLMSIAEHTRFSAGECVVQQGARNPRLWLLVEGECDVLRDVERPPEGEGKSKINGRSETRRSSSPLLLATLSPISTFGEMSFFQSAAHSASVTAKTAVELLFVTPERFADFKAARPDVACKLAINLVAGLAERLRRMDQWVAELSLAPKAVKKAPELALFRDKLFQDWNL